MKGTGGEGNKVKGTGGQHYGHVTNDELENILTLPYIL